VKDLKRNFWVPATAPDPTILRNKQLVAFFTWVLSDLTSKFSPHSVLRLRGEVILSVAILQKNAARKGG